MTVVTLICLLLLLGFIAWAVGHLTMVEEPFVGLIRGVLLFVAIIVVTVWVLGLFGVLSGPVLHLRLR